MAYGNLLLLEGFDYLSGSAGLAVANKWSTITFGTGVATIASGRFGGSCLRANDTSNNFILRRDLPATRTRMHFGFAVKFRANPAPASQEIAYFTTNPSANKLAMLYANSNRSFTLWRWGSNVVGTTMQFAQDVWYYIEIEVYLHASSGYVKLFIDGSLMLDSGPVDTRPAGASTQIESAGFGGTTWRTPIDIDDLYIADCTGDSSPTIYGGCRISTFQPTSAETNVGWVAGGTASSVTDGVAGTAPADDGKYATADDVDDILLMDSTGTLPSGVGAVRGVATTIRHSKTDGATRAIRHVLKSGGTEYPASSDVALTGSVTMSQRIWQADPDTTDPWEIADVEAASFGLKITV